MKLFYLISILFFFNGCNAQTQNEDSIPKEFEFINVFLPENLETISYYKLNSNLTTFGASIIKENKTENNAFINVSSDGRIDTVKDKNQYLYYTKRGLNNNLNIKTTYKYNNGLDTLKWINIIIQDDYTYCYNNRMYNLSLSCDTDTTNVAPRSIFEKLLVATDYHLKKILNFNFLQEKNLLAFNSSLSTTLIDEKTTYSDIFWQTLKVNDKTTIVSIKNWFNNNQKTLELEISFLYE